MGESKAYPEKTMREPNGSVAAIASRQGPIVPLAAESAAELLLASLNREPNSTAILSGARRYTYRDLLEQTESLASRLRGLALPDHTRIGLCMGRSFELITAMLASWRIGASWVPLDPGYPPSRLEFIATDAAISLMIVTPQSRSEFEWLPQQRLCLDSTDEVETQYSGQSLGQRGSTSPAPGDEAYAIYTSGSTGLPKGVSIPHRALVNFLQAMADRPGMTATDRLLAVTTPSFDISVLELLLPLTVGATVVIADTEDVQDGARLNALIDEHAITIMQATASTWRILLASEWRGSESLRALIGGEPLSPALAMQLSQRCSEVWNMYGPTETTVWSSCWQVPKELSRQIFLGQPIANTRIDILDETLNPCGIDSPGEICISGLGVALGYIERPDETARRFVRTDADDDNYSILYRTGDLARWTAERALEFMGRLDTQVKIRGRRIELGEIEARLEEHPDVADAAAAVCSPAPGDTRLVAYVVSKTNDLNLDSLRDFVADWLPDYMVPQHLVGIPSLPLLSNGKVDRNSLALIPFTSYSRDATEPRTETEKTVHGIWCDLLGLRSIGKNESFFELGGHSLLAAQVAERLRRTLNISDDVPSTFQYPTIATLAAALDGETTPDRELIIQLQTRGSLPPIFCIGGIHLFQALANEFSPARPVYGTYVPGGATAAESQGSAPSVTDLAQRYVDLIRRERPHGPYCLVGFSFGGVIAHAAANLLTKDGEQVALLGIIDSDAPGTIRKNRLFRLRLRLRRAVSKLRRRRAIRTDTENDDDAGAATAAAVTGDGTEFDISKALGAHVAEAFNGTIVFVEALADNDDTVYGWEALASHVYYVGLSTFHLGLLQPPNVGVLARALEAQLATVGSASALVGGHDR